MERQLSVVSCQLPVASLSVVKTARSRQVIDLMERVIVLINQYFANMARKILERRDLAIGVNSIDSIFCRQNIEIQVLNWQGGGVPSRDSVALTRSAGKEKPLQRTGASCTPEGVAVVTRPFSGLLLN